MLKPAIAYVSNNLDFQDIFTQKNLIKKFSKKRDFEIKKWFIDNLEFENRFCKNRPGLTSLINWIESHNQENLTLITVGVGRLTLDFDNFIEIQKKLQDKNITMVAIDCELSLNEEEQKLLTRIETVLSDDQKYFFKKSNE